MFKNSPPEVSSNKNTVQMQNEPTGEQTRRNTIPAKPLCNFIEITPMHGCTPRIHITPAKHFSPEEQLYVKIVLKDLNYKKLLFTTVKRNLFTLKNK